METIHLTDITLLLRRGVPQNPDVPLAGTASKLGDFLFTGGLFFAKFNGQLFQRMDAADIFKHLTNKIPHPLISDSGRAWQSLPGGYTEYCADFCSAQLVHYGLKQPESGVSSMQQLLASFGGPDGQTLTIPKSIIELQNAMASSKWATGGGESTDESSSEADIKLDETPKDAFLDADQASSKVSAAPFANATASLKRARQSSLGPERNVRRRSKSPKDKIVVTTPKEWVKMYKLKISKTTMSASEIRHGIKSLKANEARQLLGKLMEKSPAAKQMYETEHTFAVRGGIDSRIKLLKANEARGMLTALADKPSLTGVLARELSLFTTSPANPAVAPSQFGGLYDIEAPCLDSPRGHTLEVYPSSTSSHLWGSIDLGVVSGVIRSIYAPPPSFDTEVYFEWRGRESSENVMYFNEANRAIITFHPGGLLDGKISVPRHGTFKIYGSIRVDHGTGISRKGVKRQLAEVRSYKQTWRSLNEHNYDIESRARWGKWVGGSGGGGGGGGEEVFDSDTTVGRGKRSWKIDFQDFMRDPDTDPDDEDEEDEDEEDDSDEEDEEEEDSEEEESEENSQEENSEEMDYEEYSDGEY